MVTHDLRMCKYVDKVFQMVDGKIVRVITDRADIDLLAGTSQFDRLDEPALPELQERFFQGTLRLRAAIPAFAGGD